MQMTYMKVVWTHSFEHEPVELLSELDAQRREIRKVEIFRDGTLSFAGPDGASGDTCLGEGPLPSVDEITRDPQFRISTTNRDTFERSWHAATMAAAA
jgi:hypothetical protein